MAQMDISPITERILLDARQTADSYMSEARARIHDMQAATDRYVEDSQRQATEDARQEGQTLEQNLRRLGALEDRKALLALKHRLIAEGFDLAYERLTKLPDDALRQLFMERVLAVAEGHEALSAGALRPGFFAGFVEEANRRLAALGRPAGLREAGQQRAGELGVILASPGSEVHCTARTLLDEKRDSLEARVSAILCEDLR